MVIPEPPSARSFSGLSAVPYNFGSPRSMPRQMPWLNILKTIVSRGKLDDVFATMQWYRWFTPS